jgi:UPF0176 protein
MTLSVYSFYRFVPLPDFEALREPWLKLCNDLKIKGTILLAEEGLNASLSAEKSVLDQFMQTIAADERFKDLRIIENIVTEIPFKRMFIKLKREIVNMGLGSLPIDAKRGAYLEANEWDDLIQQPDVVLVDTRNDFEVEMGTFKGALDPKTTSFTKFPEWANKNLNPAKHKKVAMFCTGGIRCEKSTSYLKAQGFEEVYHLKGGILQYLADTENKNGLWQGECFVFDDRRVADL